MTTLSLWPLRKEPETAGAGSLGSARTAGRVELKASICVQDDPITEMTIVMCVQGDPITKMTIVMCVKGDPITQMIVEGRLNRWVRGGRRRPACEAR